MSPNTQKGADAKKAAAIRIAKQNARINAEHVNQLQQVNPNFENKPSGTITEAPIPPRIKSWDEKELTDPAELYAVIKKAILDGKLSLNEIIESELCEEATIQRETRQLVLTIVKGGKKIGLKSTNAEIFKQACSVMGVTDIEHLPSEPETYMETPQPPLSGEEAFLALGNDDEKFDTLEQPSTIIIQGKSGLEMALEELDKRVTFLEDMVGKMPLPVAPNFVEVLEGKPNPIDLDEVTLIAVKKMDGKFSKKKLSDELLIQFPACSNIVIDTAIKKALFRFRKDKK